MQSDGDVPVVSGCEKRCHSSPVMDLPFFKDSFSNIRLEIHLGSSQWGHTDTITNISFHYCIWSIKWHIYILSAWGLDKQLQQIGLDAKEQKIFLRVFAGSIGMGAQLLSLASYFCCLPSFCLTAKNADSPAEFPTFWFSLRSKDDKWGLHPVDEHVTKVT